MGRATFEGPCQSLIQYTLRCEAAINEAREVQVTGTTDAAALSDVAHVASMRSTLRKVTGGTQAVDETHEHGGAILP